MYFSVVGIIREYMYTLKELRLSNEGEKGGGGRQPWCAAPDANP